MGTVRFIHAYHSLGAAILVRFLTCFGVCDASIIGRINKLCRSGAETPQSSLPRALSHPLSAP
jgi:hypothetical protein